MASIFLPPEQTRLVTICAHVDHGKTTLADNLIESNGIISERLAGTLRYLDSLEEEQRRGITMRASAIGLKHKHQSKPKEPPVDIIVHLLDSPGHTDFSTEVSSSLQCCDGCLLVVDAVEGMCARTHQVVREAQAHQLVPILVINKLDRLCTSLCLTPTEAYMRLRNLIESVNAACAANVLSKQAMEENQHSEDQEEWTFDPAKGNVVFASALYGWGFTIPSLARSLFRQNVLPIKAVVLKQCLFGDFKYKDGKVLKWKSDSADQPLFAEYGLQPIWEIYESVASASAACGAVSTLFADRRIVDHPKSSEQAKIKSNTPGMDQVLALMQSGNTNVNKPPKSTEDLQNILTRTGSSTEDSVLRSLLRRYRPLSDTALDAVFEVCPSPVQAALSVRPRALAFSTDEMALAREAFVNIQDAVKKCDTSAEAPTVAHICKFMATDRSHIRDPHLVDDPQKESSIIMGLARVLSGRLKTGCEYHVMGPKHTSGNVAPKRNVRLYLLMGSSYVLVNEVPAGHLCAILNLDDLQLKTATLCDSPDGMPLQGFDHGIRPLVKVNVESVDPANTYELERGLIKLSLADAAVEVMATAKGERILACLGELHLEQSILDLKKVYCGKDIELRISDPIVEFGETTEWFENEMDFGSFYDSPANLLRQCTLPPYNEEEGLEFANRGRTRTILSGRLCAIRLRTVPLKLSVYSALRARSVVSGSEDELVLLGKALGISNNGEDLSAESVLIALTDTLCSIDESGNAIVESKTLSTGTSVRGTISDNGEVYVPKKNLIIDRSEEDEEEGDATELVESPALQEFTALGKSIRQNGFLPQEVLQEPRPADTAALNIWRKQMRGSVVAAFQNALRAGPICEEPVRGVLVVLEGVEVAVAQSAGPENEFKCAKPLSGGMVVAALRSGIRCSLLTRPSRLMESHLRLTLHSSLTGLGSLYTVLSKRRGKVLEDSMVDGTDLLSISATLPHAESFGLAPELFRLSSGEVTAPELIFSHWERLDQDPFWIPTSLTEREDFGEILQNGDVSTGMDNTALKYIRKVRERKGLLVDSSRTVVAAEKQRTLKR